MTPKSTSIIITLATLLGSMTASAAMPIEFRQFQVDIEARDDVLSCHPITIDQMKSLSGWGKIEQYAKDNWGEGGVNLEANPKDYQDRPLQACIKGSKIPVQFSEQPQCTSSKNEITGKSVGAGTEIEFETKKGISQTCSWTVTQSTSITAGVKFGVSIDVPAIGSATAETYMETTITNERSTSFSGTNNHEETMKVKFANEDGKQCKMELVTQSCTATAKGRAPIVATGFIWFNYEDKRAPKNNPEDGEHYKYAANIDSILSEEERTTFIEFQGPLNSRTSSAYDTNCSKI